MLKMADLVVSTQAYCKVVLHAAKYPHCAVNGVLLAERPKSKESKGVKIVDSIPLFHLSLNLSPMMEVALTQIDSYCKSQGLVIGGYYQANEHFKNATPNSVAYKVADKIHDNYSEACLFMLDNQKMSAECNEEVFRIYCNQDGKWKQQEHKDSVEEGTLETTSSFLQQKTYRDLVDFDNHLDDISLDWRNPAINELLKHST